MVEPSPKNGVPPGNGDVVIRSDGRLDRSLKRPIPFAQQDLDAASRKYRQVLDAVFVEVARLDDKRRRITASRVELKDCGCP